MHQYVQQRAQVIGSMVKQQEVDVDLDLDLDRSV